MLEGASGGIQGEPAAGRRSQVLALRRMSADGQTAGSYEADLRLTPVKEAHWKMR